MAAYTSTQSGDFNNTATWGGGGYPSADGDTFTVAAGHTVTYNLSSPLTNGFGDSTVIGTFTHASGTTQIRMNGTLFVNATGHYIMNPDSTHFIKGSQADQHGVYIRGQNLASFTAIGSEAMPTTTLSSGISYGATVFPVSSASDFSVGDWIAIYREEPAVGEENDEGVIVHDIDGNDIYFKQFVTPSSIVTAHNSADIFVENAKVFRVGQKVIAGTGVDRNIKTITSIDYPNHKLVCDSALSGSISGSPLYLTGTLRVHDSGETVRKNAATLAADASQSATEITLSNAAMFDVNDEIILEHSFAATNNSTWNVNLRHTITNKSGNTLTIDPALPLAAASGAFVTVWNRDCSIRSDDSNSYGYFYAEAYGSNYNKIFYVKNAEFRGLGNSQNSFYRGFITRTLAKTNFRTNGAVIQNSSFENLNYGTSYSGLTLWNYAHYAVVRNNVIFRVPWHGLWETGNVDSVIVNNFSVGCSSSNFYFESNQGQRSIKAFNRGSRTNGYGIYFTSPYSGSENVHHNSIDLSNYAFYLNFADGSLEFWQNEFTNILYSPYRDWQNSTRFVYNLFTTRDTGQSFFGVGRPVGSSSNASINAGGTDYGYFESIEHNYEYDLIYQQTYHAARVWDSAEGAWRFIRRYDSSGNAGFDSIVYMPAGATITAIFSVKLHPTWNGTQPYATIRSVTSPNGLYAGRAGDTNPGKEILPIFVDTQASFNTSGYTDLTLTATNTSSRGTFVRIGLYSTSNNASEGWWEKPIKVLINPPYANVGLNQPTLRDSQNIPRASINGAKTILGGSVIR